MDEERQWGGCMQRLQVFHFPFHFWYTCVPVSMEFPWESHGKQESFPCTSLVYAWGHNVTACHVSRYKLPVLAQYRLWANFIIVQFVYQLASVLPLVSHFEYTPHSTQWGRRRGAAAWRVSSNIHKMGETDRRTDTGLMLCFPLDMIGWLLIFGPIPWGHSGPLCHALSLSLSLSSLSSLLLSWTSHAACAIAIAGVRQ